MVLENGRPADTAGRLDKEIRVVSASQGGAKGSAILAAAAAGLFPDVAAAVKTLADDCDAVYYPQKENVPAYEKLYAQYCRVSAHFAQDPVMKELKNI